MDKSRQLICIRKENDVLNGWEDAARVLRQPSHEVKKPYIMREKEKFKTYNPLFRNQTEYDIKSGHLRPMVTFKSRT